MPTINLIFKPINKTQNDFVESKAERVLFSGAFGAGKSMALCTKGLKLSLDYPKNYGMICRKVRATLKETTLKTFNELVCPPALIADYNKSEGLFTLTNGSQILFGGLDDPLKLGSLNLGWCGIDEAIETNEEDWKMLEGRLRLPGVLHQIFAATNPGAPSHYLHKMFFQEKRGEVFQAGSLENPELPEDYRRRLGTFEGTYYQRNVLGQWAGLEGLVYSSFDERICIVPRFEIPKRWLIHAGHDFGDANPAALFYAQDVDTGNFYLFAEYLPGGGHSIYDHVQEFKKITGGYNVVKRVGGSHQEGQIREGYTAQGWPIAEPKYSKDRKYQIQKVQGLHRLNKIFIFSDMKEYLREKLSFAYPKIGDQLGDDPMDERRFHLMACERYVLSEFAPETEPQEQKITVWKY
jgi:PBSX family phage terminase large subunit